MKILAQANNPFGQIAPPPGSPGGTGDAATGFGQLLTKGIAIFIMIAAIMLLVYMLWGAWDWISSEGQKEKISKAQAKLTHSIIGFVLIFVALAVFLTVTSSITNIVTVGQNGFEFTIPHF